MKEPHQGRSQKDRPATDKPALPSSFTAIRSLYRPLQPTITGKERTVVYSEYAPAPALQPFIYCYWQLRTTTVLSQSFTYRVIADGCTDIFFDMNDPADSSVMGFCTSYTEFPLGTSFHYAGIRFLPTMFSQLFDVPASPLTDCVSPLKSIKPGLAGLLSNALSRGLQPPELVTILDHHLSKTVAEAKIDPDTRFYEAIRQILDQGGDLPLDKGLDTGISARQLRRLFDRYIGVSMKGFAKVIRFQKLLQSDSSDSVLRSKLFIDAGYYDQAHFIKEFRRLYGVTPTKALPR